MKTYDCILVGGKLDGELLVLSNLCKVLEFPKATLHGFGVIRYIRQHEKMDGKIVYNFEYDKGEAS